MTRFPFGEDVLGKYEVKPRRGKAWLATNTALRFLAYCVHCQMHSAGHLFFLPGYQRPSQFSRLTAITYITPW